MNRAEHWTAATRWTDPWSLVADPDQPRWLRRRLQRQLRREQRATVAALDAYRDNQGRPYAGQECARYLDSRGWIGVDRYIQSCLRRRRQSRVAPAHTPWGRLLEEWTPERRCAHVFAVDARGEAVHHDDPRAVRWCLGGWLAHRCQRAAESSKHFQSQAEREANAWHRRTDDREARRLLNEVWALVPERTRAVVERIWRDRVKPADRKRLDQHPLGFWYFLAPHLAERWLGIAPSAELAPVTQRAAS